MNDELVVGIDVGSQGTCAQAIALDGITAAISYVPHTLSYPRPGWAEQDPDGWLSAVAQALNEVRLAVQPRPISAIAFGSQLDGLVAADAEGAALGPAVIWMDRRASAECERAAGQIDPARLRELTGCNLDPGHVAAKMAWLRANRPDQHDAARWLLLPGSFVAWRAVGELAVDPSNASSSMLLDLRTCDWCEEACAAFGVDVDRLAPVRPATHALGPVAPWLREAAGLSASTLVILGCGDEMAATLGAGVIETGTVCDVVGTAEPVCAVVAEPALDPGCVTEVHPHASPDGWLLENPGWLSGGAYRWFRDELGASELAKASATGADVYQLLNDSAATVPPGAEGVLWVPALAGATAPEWNPNARAAWFGLTTAHRRAHLARALLEGNAFALRDVLDAMRTAGLKPTELVCVAGGARGDLLLQIRADVTGLPVTRPEDVETTARGAAMLAAAGARLHPDVATAVTQMAGPRREPVHPDPERQEIYADAYERYRQLYSALRPLF
ncbi:MAG TPA: FGGY family carbohydrate kinase [Solirubrobacteraceae bacterium]|nr:FGGY family carbohydrate kinase [Solirubrobacteraceae bacterium]